MTLMLCHDDALMLSLHWATDPNDAFELSRIAANLSSGIPVTAFDSALFNRVADRWRRNASITWHTPRPDGARPYTISWKKENLPN